MIPLALGLVGADGRDMPLTLDDGRAVDARRADADQGRAELHASPASRERPVLSLNRGFSAPVKLAVQRHARTTCAFLAAHDSDPFNRWQAVQIARQRAAGRQCRGDPRRPATARATTD